MLRSIRIPDALWRRLRIKAAEDGERLSGMAERVLLAGLSAVESGPIVQKPRPKRLVDPTTVDPRTLNTRIIAQVAEHPADPAPYVALPKLSGAAEANEHFGKAWDEHEAASQCPKCQCRRSVHQSGASKTRCERHPGCRWEP